MAFGSGIGRTRLNDPQLRKLRALMILQHRVEGMSPADLAKKFHVSEHTIRNEIDYAKREGLVAQFEDQMIEALLPKAIKAYQTALENGDTTVATEVLKGMGILRKPTERPLLRPERDEPQEDTLEFHIKRISKGGKKLEDSYSQQRRLAPSAAQIIDAGSILEDSTIIEADPAPAVGQSRDESGATHHQEHVDPPADAAGLPAQPAVA